MESKIQELVSQLVGIRCEGVQNPHGSILALDFGPLGLRVDDDPATTPHGWRHLTVSSPWRVQDRQEVLFDWNVDGGTHGLLPRLIPALMGLVVTAAATEPPAWDLTIELDNDWKLVIFGDCNDFRDDAWFILGTDGAEAVARPRVRPLAPSEEL